jgi:hypothetical protein
MPYACETQPTRNRFILIHGSRSGIRPPLSRQYTAGFSPLCLGSTQRDSAPSISAVRSGIQPPLSRQYAAGFRPLCLGSTQRDSAPSVSTICLYLTHPARVSVDTASLASHTPVRVSVDTQPGMRLSCFTPARRRYPLIFTLTWGDHASRRQGAGVS